MTAAEVTAVVTDVAEPASVEALADEHGPTPEEHAERVFEMIAEGRYRAIPQPEQLCPALKARTDMILGQENPRPQPG
ncbi:hypothetical protein [Streptomyces sp. NK15101]|uniref:hypothetical protein n=1 Tax=Streptomyces sp. NK15101 TaxID=2873261 RepID=UPI001CEDF838|nr:hypothetical protein [Streptomyces sp. NK15101]